MCAYLILGLGALCMTQVNWASSPATNTAFLILFTKRGGTTGNMLKYNSCLNTLEVSHETTTYAGLFSKKWLKYSWLITDIFSVPLQLKPKHWGILGHYHTMSLTLNSDLAQSAGVAGWACGKAHVLSRIICCHVVKDQCAGTIRVLNDDVMRISLHSTSIYVQQVKQSNTFGLRCCLDIALRACAFTPPRTKNKWRTLVPSDRRFGYASGFTGQFNSLSQLCGAVCQNFVKVRRTCEKIFIMKGYVWKSENTKKNIVSDEIVTGKS